MHRVCAFLAGIMVSTAAASAVPFNTVRP